MLSQAIPDAGGAMAGLEMAMTLATGEKIVADARNATADDPIYLGPFLRGSVAVGQGPTLVSCFQYLQDVDAQRRATNEVYQDPRQYQVPWVAMPLATRRGPALCPRDSSTLLWAAHNEHVLAEPMGLANWHKCPIHPLIAMLTSAI